jgi:hypothetical protein
MYSRGVKPEKPLKSAMKGIVVVDMFGGGGKINDDLDIAIG